VETEYWMQAGIAAFGVHQHRLTKSPTDRFEECAEDVECRLTPDLAQIDVKVDLRGA